MKIQAQITLSWKLSPTLPTHLSFSLSFTQLCSWLEYWGISSSWFRCISNMATEDWSTSSSSTWLPLTSFSLSRCLFGWIRKPLWDCGGLALSCAKAAPMWSQWTCTAMSSCSLAWAWTATWPSCAQPYPEEWEGETVSMQSAPVSGSSRASWDCPLFCPGSSLTWMANHTVQRRHPLRWNWCGVW